jgi:predicted transposase YdaD
LVFRKKRKEGEKEGKGRKRKEGRKEGRKENVATKINEAVISVSTWLNPKGMIVYF